MNNFDLLKYLEQNFPTLEFGGGLFYRWPVGIRFALGGRGSEPEVLAIVKQRAVALYEAVFSAADDCVILSEDYEGSQSSSEMLAPQSLFHFAEHHDIGLLQHVGEFSRPHDPEEPTPLFRYTIQSSRSFRYDTILEAIGNADHALSPAIDSWVYFINPRTSVVLHMYDDRGLDVIACRPQTLLRLYRTFNAWILDYDRAQIDSVFAGLNGVDDIAWR